LHEEKENTELKHIFSKTSLSLTENHLSKGSTEANPNDRGGPINLPRQGIFEADSD
jgi:hypothetical protein